MRSLTITLMHAMWSVSTRRTGLPLPYSSKSRYCRSQRSMVHFILFAD